MENCLCHPPTALSTDPQPAGVVDASRRFDSVRRALLADFADVVVAGAHPIRQLATSHPQALGNVIPESWAIVSEILAFYDVRITENLFIGSATNHVTLRRLADLLGYLPLPAVASAAHIALVGSQTEVPASTRGLTLRASAPSPQVFEPDEVKTLSWLPRTVTLAPVRDTVLSVGEEDDTITLLLEAKTAAPRRNSPVLFIYGYKLRASEILTVTASQELDGSDYVEIVVTNPKTFNPALAPFLLGDDVEVRNVSILSPAQQAFVRTWLFGNPTGAFELGADLSPDQDKSTLNFKPGGYGPSVPWTNSPGEITTNTSIIELDGVYRSIKVTDIVILQKGAVFSPHRVTKSKEVMRRAVGEGPADDVTKPELPITSLTLNPKLSDEFLDPLTSDKLIIHYNLHDIGRLINPAHSELTAPILKAKGKLELEGFHKAPPGGSHSGQWLLEDANGRGALVDADFDVGPRGRATLTLTGNPTWSTPLRVPVVAHPNILRVTRGETVNDEVLGNGDPVRAGQSFQLKKSPLTYVQAAGGAGQGAKSTLEVRVDGVRWHERRTFYGAGPNDQIYIVRHDDDEKATVIFGDGVRGARLPAGVRNIRATYRFGAGAESPPFGNLTQIVRGVPGLTRVRNPVPAAGGADRESAEDIRKNAPTSALLLGRCVSLTDFGARVAGFPGVLNSRVELGWDQAMLAAVVKVWFVPTVADDATLGERIVKDLQALAEPGAQIQAIQAIPLRTFLGFDIAVDADYVAADVEKAVVAALLDPNTGALAPGRTPIGGGLARSALVATALAIPGVLEVTGLLLKLLDPGGPMLAFNLKPQVAVAFPTPGVWLPGGYYLDFEDPSSGLLNVHATLAVARDCCDLGS